MKLTLSSFLIALVTLSAMGEDRPEWHDEKGKSIYYPRIKMTGTAAASPATALLTESLRVKIRVPDQTGKFLQLDAKTPTKCVLNGVSIADEHITFLINGAAIKNKTLFTGKEGEILDIKVQVSADAGLGQQKGKFECGYGYVGYTWKSSAHIPLSMNVEGEIK
jgi:hypothetical protein